MPHAARSTLVLASVMGVTSLAGCAETNPSRRYMIESRERYERLVSLVPKFEIIDNDKVPMSPVCTGSADDCGEQCGGESGAENVQWKRPRERRVCLDWASKLEEGGDEAKASELYVKMCQVGFSHACLAEARLCARGKGSCEGDGDKTLAFYVGGCHAKDVDGCLEGQKYYLEGGDWGTYQTDTFLYEACRGGHRGSCRILWKGPRPPKVPPSPNKYSFVVRKACVLGDVEACVRISKDVENSAYWEAHWAKVEQKRRDALAVHEKRVAEAVKKQQAAAQKASTPEPEPEPEPLEGDLGAAFAKVWDLKHDTCENRLASVLGFAERHCNAHLYWASCDADYTASKLAEFFHFNPHCH